MKLAYVDLCGFRGYRQRLRLDFADAFTIIDGRNGVGKSTIFDAVEYVLTGTLSKYDEAKASGETVADYLWWTGDGPQPRERYVEVGFSGEGEVFPLRRTQFQDADPRRLQILASKLSDLSLAPPTPLKQLCSTSIIRDEHIASLSLDLKEADRYSLLRDALGANDSEKWIARAGQLVTLTKRRSAAAQQEVTTINAEAGVAARRIDEVRSNLIAEDVVAASVERLRVFADSEVPPDRLAGPVRTRMAEDASRIDLMELLLSRWDSIDEQRLSLNLLQLGVQEAEAADRDADRSLASQVSAVTPTSASAMSARARDLIALVSAGRRLGLQDEACPLCATKQSHSAFELGMEVIQSLAATLDAEAARQAEAEASRGTAQRRKDEAQRAVASAKKVLADSSKAVQDFTRDLRTLGLEPDVGRQRVSERIAVLRRSLDIAQRDLRVLDTLRLHSELERAQRAEADTGSRLARAQEKFGRARKAETVAQALHDAARRAAGENLDRRLDRVLPLMAELYKRFRPHPIWTDIEYSIRGDVRRFLKLQVGDELNPQFLFSSGQRRATGLAFLLSVNVSLAWSRWQSILLDDPVQHVDDFRTVHLAEVLAQFVVEGRQIICAVEDAALADLLCRRLPVQKHGVAKRITLGPDSEGSLAKIQERDLIPLARRVFAISPEISAAG